MTMRKTVLLAWLALAACGASPPSLVDEVVRDELDRSRDRRRLAEAHAVSPDDVGITLALAERLLTDDDVAGARGLLAEAMAKASDPRLALAAARLAETPAAALDFSTKAMSEARCEPEALELASEALLRLGSPKEAIEKARALVAADSSRTLGWVTQVVAHSKQGNPELADEALLRACGSDLTHRGLGPVVMKAVSFLYAGEPSWAALRDQLVQFGLTRPDDSVGPARPGFASTGSDSRIGLLHAPRLGFGSLAGDLAVVLEAPWLHGSIEAHDRLLAANGVVVAGFDGLRKLEATWRVGDRVMVRVMRGGREIEETIVVEPLVGHLAAARIALRDALRDYGSGREEEAAERVRTIRLALGVREQDDRLLTAMRAGIVRRGALATQQGAAPVLSGDISRRSADVNSWDGETIALDGLLALSKGDLEASKAACKRAILLGRGGRPLVRLAAGLDEHRLHEEHEEATRFLTLWMAAMYAGPRSGIGRSFGSNPWVDYGGEADAMYGVSSARQQVWVDMMR